jgi:SAM-dependent methyltransferase
MTANASMSVVTAWDNLWRHAPDFAKDNALLAREEQSPRWHTMLNVLTHEHRSLSRIHAIELGSGRGDLSALLARRGARVTLLDTSERALIQARRRFDRIGLDADFECRNMFDEIARRRARFDLAISSGVIEHFAGADRTRALRAHYETLRPGGVTIISVPHAWCIPYRLWKAYLEARGCWPYGREIPYSRHEILRRGRDAGFSDGQAVCLGFWHSISAHWGRSILGLDVDWAARSSPLDSMIGLILLYIARRPV